MSEEYDQALKDVKKELEEDSRELFYKHEISKLIDTVREKHDKKTKSS